MSAHKFHKQQPFVIAHQHDQSVVIAFDVKHDTVVGRETGIPVCLLKDDLNNPPLNRVGAIQLSDCGISASNL